MWYGTLVVLIWSSIGLLSLRFDISAHIELPNLLFSMLLLVGMVLSFTANYYLVGRYRERNRPLWHALSYLPFIWGTLISAGLFIMILQVWTDFSWGSEDIRRTMSSLIGVGVCGTYGGYLAIVVVGPERIYEVIRSVLYVVLAIIAAQILDAIWPIWPGDQGLSGQEMVERFGNVGGTAISVAVVYAIIALVLPQANDKKALITVVGTYVSLGLIGFTLAVAFLTNSLPAGAIRFVHGGAVFVTITTIGLLLVQHIYTSRDVPNLSPDSEERSGQPGS